MMRGSEDDTTLVASIETNIPSRMPESASRTSRRVMAGAVVPGAVVPGAVVPGAVVPGAPGGVGCWDTVFLVLFVRSGPGVVGGVRCGWCEGEREAASGGCAVG
ncbi:hypothetical protein CUD01_07850 [Cellulomonas uda]|uniref:Uncharacterized protein n=1 Tax=Cellulomonas uda TaxID=1714 RepID=A0A4Y3K732_CELUD|nr:hypothetical protein CUD01_07850 [Cellulomonas uda]